MTGGPIGISVQARQPDACYGMTCPLRGQCELYAQLGLKDGSVIVHCRIGNEWPLFRQRVIP